MLHLRYLPAAAAAFLLATTACVERVDNDAAPADTVGTATAPPPQTMAPPPVAPTPSAEMRIEVDVNSRELHVYRNEQRSATHRVAVGSSEWPTRTGEWTISQVVWNPEWIPPDESWAEERERKDPGAPDNPLGRAQLVYDAPRSIHGTNDPSSIGKAVSHGSIRVTNDVATQLARQVMEAGGARREEDWYRRARENRREKQVVDLPNPVPIRVF
jgi:lipoprotein-anchoring transpeptidase ErfK/SrfK